MEKLYPEFQSICSYTQNGNIEKFSCKNGVMTTALNKVLTLTWVHR